ncbi:GDSL-type esterase/lipase family protein [Lactococcus allomyrinae]|uniref:Esterase n=1 Tax=Lactococcus allomyrinae TaxID=2419773 RepID=A0A387BJX5_9LACT|nr:GDSL-type esterase/lipase family protein [Lactococcus allomyrinae]AYG01260.1 esterase [Lactococcus allomyrinae]
MKITIFGDSITNGYMAENPLILKDLIEEKVPQIEVKLHGINGDDTYGAQYRIKYVKAENADLNFVFFGANDASPYHLIRPDEFKQNLTKIINQLGREETILITPPYYNELEPTHYSKLSEVKLFRQATLDLAQEKQLPVIDIFQAMVDFPEPNALLRPDGLHFTEAGYEVLADKIVECIGER